VLSSACLDNSSWISFSMVFIWFFTVCFSVKMTVLSKAEGGSCSSSFRSFCASKTRLECWSFLLFSIVLLAFNSEFNFSYVDFFCSSSRICVFIDAICFFACSNNGVIFVICSLICFLSDSSCDECFLFSSKSVVNKENARSLSRKVFTNVVVFFLMRSYLSMSNILRSVVSLSSADSKSMCFISSCGV